ncbi:LytTr DNA-binding domain-containing protein [Eilatimonas milleporae]|uniref:LytTr DNA-binding domain-containing protein n=1 Tax=Eilatimonas milleporae TaxID=911205 RepID=A0A3M0CFI7_9PROT|nr:LytTr DNA-binding domain-containing protein [Eilatimonas milleporae]
MSVRSLLGFGVAGFNIAMIAYSGAATLRFTGTERTVIFVNERYASPVVSFDVVPAWGPLARLCGLLGVASGVLLSLLEPAAAPGLSFLERLVFWTGHTLPSWTAMLAVWRCLPQPDGARGFRRFIPVILPPLTGAVVLAVVSLFLEAVFGVGDMDDVPVGFAPALGDELATVTPIAVFFWGLFLLARHGLARLSASRSIPVAHGDTVFVSEMRDLPPLLQGLPDRLGTDLVSISSEAQYLRVRTPRGEAMVPGALKELDAALPPGLGFRIHRSHWVALGHCKGLRKRGGGWVCCLDTGLTLPVSRRRLAAAKKAIGPAA